MTSLGLVVLVVLLCPLSLLAGSEYGPPVAVPAGGVPDGTLASPRAPPLAPEDADGDPAAGDGPVPPVVVPGEDIAAPLASVLRAIPDGPDPETVPLPSVVFDMLELSVLGVGGGGGSFFLHEENAATAITSAASLIEDCIRISLK